MSKSILAQSPLRGIVPPLVTPLLGPDELDVEGLGRLIEHVLGGGVSGLFVLGTTGEGPSLSYRLREQMVRQTCMRVNGRVPVLVGVTDASTWEAERMAKVFADAGADGVVAAPPFYFTPSQEQLLEFIRSLADASPVPLFVYNFPAITKVTFEVQTVVRAAEHPNVMGFKDSSGNMVYFHDILLKLGDRDDFSLLVGPEELLVESVLMGSHGGVNGGANLFPSLYVRAYRAAVAGDLPLARRLHRDIYAVRNALYGIGHYGSSMIKGVKAALHAKGVCSPRMSAPFGLMTPADQNELVERFHKLEIDLGR